MSENYSSIQTKKLFDSIERASKNGEVFIIGIDGQSGSGKSTLAQLIKSKFNAQVVQMDDFYAVVEESERAKYIPAQGYANYFDWHRLEKEVLVPMTNGQNAKYEKYDWSKNTLGATEEIKAKGIIVVEGVYSLRPELQKYYDYKIFVDTKKTIRMKRLKERGNDSEEWIRRWEMAEEYYINNFNPASKADFVVE